jgi:hypothetical protein
MPKDYMRFEALMAVTMSITAVMDEKLRTSILADHHKHLLRRRFRLPNILDEGETNK